MQLMLVLLFFVCSSFAAANRNNKLSCIADDGTAVDWFIAYKLPRKAKVPVEQGYGYAYLDSRSNGFKLSKFSVANTRSAMGATMQQVYLNAKSMENEMAYIFYNDANPEGKEYFYHGHSKGDVAFNKDSGFWLIHSVPKYPSYVRDGYEYPSSGAYYGQMFFCVTFNSSQFDSIGMQLRFADPHVHDSNFPRSMVHQFPNVNALLEDDVITGVPYNRTARLVSSAGMTFLHFSKNKNFGKDLYHELVAPSLKTNLLTETWQHGSSKIGPSCDGYTVEDITQIKVETESSDTEFSNYADHSKFAVAKSGSKYVCIGDINRMTTQYKRGGGTLCTSNQYIWSHFNKLAEEVNECEGNLSDYYEYRDFL